MDLEWYAMCIYSSHRKNAVLRNANYLVIGISCIMGNFLESPDIDIK